MTWRETRLVLVSLVHLSFPFFSLHRPTHLHIFDSIAHLFKKYPRILLHFFPHSKQSRTLAVFSRRGEGIIIRCFLGG
ncbi:hypothetical protein DFS33DRAFT_1312943 [Desarmillaria ectypa]|nr:hypothetical protein DFS33DRAFT_1312943 [Desarmillaria ectypa]